MATIAGDTLGNHPDMGMKSNDNRDDVNHKYW